MTESTLRINTETLIPRRIHIVYPKPDTRIPEAQRPKPALEGYIDCEYRYYSQEEVNRQDRDIEEGDLDSDDRLRMAVPIIRGLPLNDGEDAVKFLSRFQYGLQIRAAIWEDYLRYISEGRQGNSQKRR
jgi:hypothetical protein